MKTLGRIPEDQIKKVISEAYMNIYVDQNKIFNPLEKIPEQFEEHPEGYIAWLLMQPEYFHFICKEIMNINIPPMQGVILRELWQRKFPMLIGSRGLGKSFILALYSMIRILLLPNRKVVACGAAFRQSKIIFEYMETIWNNAPILRDIVGVTNNGPKREADMFRFFIGESRVSCLPLGCLVGDSLVTTNTGIREIQSLRDENKYYIYGNSKFRDMGFFFDNGITECFTITTKRGYSFTSTPNHKMKIVRNNEIVWCRADEMKVNDFILIDRSDRWYSNDTEVSVDDAYCLGLMIGDGSYVNQYFLRYTTIDNELSNAIEKNIGEFIDYKDGLHYQIQGKQKVKDWLNLWGLKPDYSHNKSLPNKILSSSKEKMIACLQGLFDTDGHVSYTEDLSYNVVGYTTTSQKLAKQIHYILLHFGIVSTLSYRDRKSCRTGNDAKRCYEINLYGYNIKKFQDNIGFRLKRKQEKLNFIINNKQKWNTFDDILPIDRDLVPSRFVRTSTKVITFAKAKKIPDEYIKFDKELLNENNYYDVVNSVEKSINQHTFDINIPEGNEYCSNGFYSHNTGDKIRGQRANDILADEFACLGFETLIQTDKGLKRIKEYLDGNVYSLLNVNNEFETPDTIFVTPKTDVYTIRCKKGYSFRCSEKHQVLTTKGWKLAKDLTNEDSLEISFNDYFPKEYVSYNETVVNEDIGWLIGEIISEGYVGHRNSISINTTSIKLKDRLLSREHEEWKSYHKSEYINKRGWKCKESYQLVYSNTEFRTDLYKLGIDYTTARQKVIPRCILESPREVVVSFLHGLFDGDGSGFYFESSGKKKIGFAYYSGSEQLINELQILFLKFGIFGCKIPKKSKISKKIQWALHFRDSQAYHLFHLLKVDKWSHLKEEDLNIRFRKPHIRKNGIRYIVSTNKNNKNVHIGTFNTEEECKLAFAKFWKTTKECVRVRDVVKADEKEVLYDFHMPKTNSFIGNGFVQHNSIPREIFETVIGGFAAVAANPIDNVISKASEKMSKILNIERIETDKTDVGNQTLISGTADYDFNHFYEYWCNWKDIITTKGDRKKIAAYLNKKNPENFVDEESIPPSFDWRDYSIIRIPYELIPAGFMDAATVSRAKASVHYGTYLCEYGSCFSKDSNGFYKRSLVENCSCSELNPIYHPSGPVFFKSVIVGNPIKKYVYGIDPAADVDNFAIVVLELHADHRRIVYGWTTNKKNQKELLANGTIVERDYYSFCARKIRDLMKKFPCAGIAIDYGGGGSTIIERLNDTDKIKPGEQFIWPLINPEKPLQTDGETGLHIMNIVQFSSADWTTNANHYLKSDMETKSLVFPFFDPIELAAVENSDEKTSNIDSVWSCMLEIEELKSELSTIVITKTPTGRYKWDTPALKLPGNKKGYLRKDRYSALLMANDLARSIEIFNPKPIESSYEGGFAHTFLREDTKGPSYKGPSAIADKLNALYS